MTLQTVLDLITQAAGLIGAIQQGQTLNGSEQGKAFLSLNGFVDQLNSERENLFYIPEQLFGLNPGQQAYTIGVGGQFNVPRPIEIQTASGVLVTSGGALIRNPLDLLTENEWNSIADRNQTGNRLDAIYYDHNFPVGTIFVDPIPGPGTTLSLSISTWSPLPTFTALTDVINLPPSYWEMLLWGLAVRIAPQFGAVVDQQLVAMVNMTAKSKMQKINRKSAVPGVQQKTLPVVGMPDPPNPQAAPEV